jgi:hypothetical protein
MHARINERKQHKFVLQPFHYQKMKEILLVLSKEMNIPYEKLTCCLRGRKDVTLARDIATVLFLKQYPDASLETLAKLMKRRDHVIFVKTLQRHTERITRKNKKFSRRYINMFLKVYRILQPEAEKGTLTTKLERPRKQFSPQQFHYKIAENILNFLAEKSGFSLEQIKSSFRKDELVACRMVFVKTFFSLYPNAHSGFVTSFVNRGHSSKFTYIDAHEINMDPINDFDPLTIWYRDLFNVTYSKFVKTKKHPLKRGAFYMCAR